jgi:hypothetical protein
VFVLCFLYLFVSVDSIRLPARLRFCLFQALKAVRADGLCLEFASERLRGDISVVLAAVGNCGAALE